MYGASWQKRTKLFPISQGELIAINRLIFKAFERIAGRQSLEHFALWIGERS
jgi:hypothetical protein